MVNTMKLNFQNKITVKNKNFIQSVMHKLIYLEKANLVQYKSVKRRIRTKTIKISIKIKQLRSDIKST